MLSTSLRSLIIDEELEKLEDRITAKEKELFPKGLRGFFLNFNLFERQRRAQILNGFCLIEQSKTEVILRKRLNETHNYAG